MKPKKFTANYFLDPCAENILPSSVITENIFYKPFYM
jgi:hypothetical protein